jgi:DNA replication initiation complex subunit (GINS family)
VLSGQRGKQNTIHIGIVALKLLEYNAMLRAPDKHLAMLTGAEEKLIDDIKTLCKSSVTFIRHEERAIIHVIQENQAVSKA